MIFFPKHLGFHSLGILLSIYTQSWGAGILAVVRPQPNTAIAFDMAVSDYWPLLILWATYKGYFHKNCCWIRVPLCFCVMKLLILNKPCLSMFNRKWGGSPSTFNLSSCARGKSLKISPGCIPAKCNNLYVLILALSLTSSIPGYFKYIFLYRK